MEDEVTVGDANDTSVTLDPDVGLSSSPDGITINPDATARTLSTVEDDLTKGAPGTIAEGEKAEADKIAAQEAAKAAAKDGEKEIPGRYDQDPAWQRIIKERDEGRSAAERARGALEILTKQPGEAGTPAKETKPEPLPFKDISKMSKEALLEWFEDDPIGYEANRMAQLIYETKHNLAVDSEKKAAEAQHQDVLTKVQQTFDSYAKANADFNGMWDDGTLPKYMDEHPGHNAISAHMAITEEKRIAAAVAKAIKETEERVTQNFKAKRHAEVSTGHAAATKVADDEDSDTFKNPNKYGGPVAVLADRLRKMRQAKAG